MLNTYNLQIIKEIQWKQAFHLLLHLRLISVGVINSFFFSHRVLTCERISNTKSYLTSVFSTTLCVQLNSEFISEVVKIKNEM